MRFQAVETPNEVFSQEFFEAVTLGIGRMLSFDILGLMAYSTYSVSVRATNQYGVGNFSEEVTVRTAEGRKCGSHYVYKKHRDTAY